MRRRQIRVAQLHNSAVHNPTSQQVFVSTGTSGHFPRIKMASTQNCADRMVLTAFHTEPKNRHVVVTILLRKQANAKKALTFGKLAVSEIIAAKQRFSASPHPGVN